MEKIRELMPYIIILIIVILLKCFVVTPIRVNGTSMMNTLHPKDIMILNKTAYLTKNPKRFDIVVVRLEDEDIIKRVIGLPGEVIEYKDNTLYVNGKKVEEKVKGLNTADYKSEKIPADYYLVMGDNRAQSADSRRFGCIPLENIESKVWIRVWPLNLFGKIDK